MPEKPLILADTVANPPRGAEIVANKPDVPPVPSNMVANPPHGAGADGKHAADYAKLAKLFSKDFGSEITLARDVSILSEAVTNLYLQHGVEAVGKYATNPQRYFIEKVWYVIRARNSVEFCTDFCSNNYAVLHDVRLQLPKLSLLETYLVAEVITKFVLKYPGQSLAAILERQPALGNSTGISPKGGGVCCVWLW